MNLIFSKDILIREILSSDMALYVDHIMFFQNLMMQNFGYPFYNFDWQKEVESLNEDQLESTKGLRCSLSIS